MDRLGHHINCEFWHDQYPHECTCGVTAPLPVTDPGEGLQDVSGDR